MKLLKTFFSYCMVVGICIMISGVALAQNRSNTGPVKWMAPEAIARGELVDEIASVAGLSKADAKKALDGFINATSHALSEQIDRPVYCWGSSTTKDFLDPDDDGDTVPTMAAFGTFSVVSGGVRASGCPQPNEVVFHAGPAFSAPENPLAEESGWNETPQLESAATPPPITALEVTAPSRFYGGRDQILTFGRCGERASFHTGDGACVFDDAGRVARATVAGVLIEARRGRFQVVDSTDSGGGVIGLVLAGVNTRDVQLGMLIAQCPVARPVRCEDPIPGFDDDDLIAGIVRETRLPFDTAALALTTLYAVIADVVNNGGVVDLEGFGRFEAQTIITATITETRGPPLVVIDVWEQSVSLVGASLFEIEEASSNLEQKARRSARTGRNPQTGKEIQIAAKNVVRFKAGADLSTSVN